MIHYAILAFCAFNVVMGDESSDYAFTYKLPKVSADMVQKMKDKLTHKIVEVGKAMEQECKYVKAMEQYGFAIEMALMVGHGACSVESDITQLGNYKELYKTSIIACFEEMTSTATYDSMIDELVAEIQAIDQKVTTQAEACSGDSDCEKKVYKSTHDSLTNLYVGRIGELKVAEDQAITQGLSEIAQCMVPKVSDSLREMYLAIEKLQSCSADAADARAGSKPV